MNQTRNGGAGKGRWGRRVSCLSGLLILASCVGGAYAAVWYVDVDNTTGPRDGTSWPTAFQTIQEGVDAAEGEARKG